MSCWRRTTVLRIPAIRLGFVFWGEWNTFLDRHDREFGLGPGSFGEALCESYSESDYPEWLSGGRQCGPRDRLDMNMEPDPARPVPGPFLDYCLEEILPLPDEENTYHENDCARPLSREEREKYLPLYQGLFPDFTLTEMENVHYCRYEWYDGAEALYMY